jgi:hypothetical protein
MTVKWLKIDVEAVESLYNRCINAVKSHLNRQAITVDLISVALHCISCGIVLELI